LQSIRGFIQNVDLFLGTQFVGFKNFVTIFTDKNYYVLFLATILIAVFTIGLSLVFGMLIALAVTQPLRGRGVYRTVYYIPVVISMAVVAQIANVWLSYNDGTFNNILNTLGMGSVAWKQSTFWMYFWIIFICVWKGLGATVTSLGEIREYGANTGLLNRKLTAAEWREALYLMSRHQMIELPAAVRDVKDETPIYLYSTILLYVSAADMNELIEEYREEADDEAIQENLPADADQ